MTYNAFISYSHAADGKLAPALQRAFHRFARPLFKIRALRVFRDTASLSANPALWPAIEQALAGSDHFVLLASPEAARSRWVTREVEWWITHRSVTKLLVALTDGSIAWDAGRSDFAWEQTTALPAVLAGRFTDEPLWVDLRWAKTADDLSIRHSQFRAAVLDLAAPLHGKPKEELDSEEVRQHRKTRLLWRSAVAVLAGLTIAASLLAVYAIGQRNESEEQRGRADEQRVAAGWARNGAERRRIEAEVAKGIAQEQTEVARTQRDEAVRQRDLALSRQAASQALRTVDRRLDVALLLGVEASRMADTFDARNALLSALTQAPFLTSFLPGHRAAVTAVAFSPDGKVLASGDTQGTVIFWDLERGEMLGRPVAGHRQDVTRLAFSPDGRLLASASADHAVLVWDVARRRPLAPSPLVGHSARVSRMAFSPDGRLMASGDHGGSVRLWDVAARRSAGPPLTGKHRAITALAFAPGGNSLVSGDESGTVALWDLAAPEPAGRTWWERQFFVIDVASLPDGGVRASGLSGTNLIRWDVGREQLRVNPLSIGGQPPVQGLDTRALAVSASGQTLAVAKPDGALMVVDLAVDREHRQPADPTATLTGARRSGILAVAVSRDGRRVVSGYRDGTLAVWDTMHEHAIARSLRGPHRKAVTAVAFAPNGTTLASGSADTLMLWDTRDLRPIAALDGHTGAVSSAAFSPSGAWMASSGHDGVVRLWDVGKRPAFVRPLVGHDKKRVKRVVFVRDGRLATVGGDSKLLLWDVATGRPLPPALAGHDKGLTSAAFSPDGRTLASGGVDGTVRLWDVASHRPLGSPVVGHRGSVDAIAFSPDGRTIVTAGYDANLVLWDVTERRSLGPPFVLDPTDMDHRKSIGAYVAFSPDGAMLVSGATSRVVLWHVPSRQPLGPILHTWAEGTTFAMSPDGAVVAATRNESVVLWDVALRSWQQRACRLVNRDLTVEEWTALIGPEIPYRRTCSALPR
jgi:WD40 repeat protein